MKEKIDLDMMCIISGFLGKSYDVQEGSLGFVWIVNNEHESEVYVSFDTRELILINWVGDDKLYYSLIGLAWKNDFTIKETYTEK